MSMNNPKQRLLLSGNPSGGGSSCIKSRFTRGFLRALIKMKKQNYNQPTSSSSSSSSRREMFRRYRRVKIAADKSMAVAVGSTRLWSRAMLSRIRHHQHQTWRYHRSTFNHQPIKVKRLVIEKKKKKKKKKKKLMIKKEEDGSDDHHHHRRGLRDAGELRKLVPGGEGMDICSLLDETAHYIKCLVTQVQVMKSIDRFYSIN
ncbi:hypothetical protein EZV62_020963 [Acer yangbiense]|uniref:IBH1-like N-terminal domain-containing protein n=1 Tax=Acer yangbiense TaxID=1000413 RepID=A0A5C7HFG3_9ROSI|nr:hypothetical protein EZV62_020963 [Acer yangbiense]